MKKIKLLINKLTIKDIISIFSEEKDVSKKEIYNYCLSLKNENSIYLEKLLEIYFFFNLNKI